MQLTVHLDPLFFTMTVEKSDVIPPSSFTYVSNDTCKDTAMSRCAVNHMALIPLIVLLDKRPDY